MNEQKNQVRTLSFKCRGQWYDVRESDGAISTTNQNGFEVPCSGQWIFLGVSKYWSNNHPTIKRRDLFDNPKLALKGYVWDVDHGTTRQWGGGGEIRITGACVTENPDARGLLTSGKVE